MHRKKNVDYSSVLNLISQALTDHRNEEEGSESQNEDFLDDKLRGMGRHLS